MKGVIGLVAVLLSADLSAAAPSRCDPSTEYEVDRGSYSDCYSLGAPGPVEHHRYSQLCDRFPYVQVWELDTVKLQLVATAAKALGVPVSDEGPGAWFPYVRQQEAPLGANNYMSIRQTAPYKLAYPSGNGYSFSHWLFPSDLWRNADPGSGENDQPFDKDDERDERCMAIKNLDDPRMDSFPCDTGPDGAYMMHYAICLRNA